MRGKSPKRRKVQRDERYGSALVARLINKVMQDGKKTLAKKAVYEAIEEGSKQVKMEPVEFLETALKNVRPSLEIKARRVGGANYQVPMPVSPVAATEKENPPPKPSLISVDVTKSFANPPYSSSKEDDKRPCSPTFSSSLGIRPGSNLSIRSSMGIISVFTN